MWPSARCTREKPRPEYLAQVVACCLPPQLLLSRKSFVLARPPRKLTSAWRVTGAFRGTGGYGGYDGGYGGPPGGGYGMPPMGGGE